MMLMNIIGKSVYIVLSHFTHTHTCAEPFLHHHIENMYNCTTPRVAALTRRARYVCVEIVRRSVCVCVCMWV